MSEENAALALAKDELVERYKRWKKLPSILLNIRDVLRPIPGTPARETVGRALTASLSILEHALTSGCDDAACPNPRDERTLKQLGLLSSLVNATSEQKYGTAIQLAGSLVAGLIREDCGASGVCTVALTSKQAEKWFGVLGAFGSYAATYDAKPDGESSEAGLAEYRAEQRNAAMQELIDSATDRRARGGDWVFSAGVGVQTTFGTRFQTCETDAGCGENEEGTYTGLNLPTGFALEWLPRDEGTLSFVGFHLQLSILDLGQFVTTSKAELAEATPATPFYFGAQVGFLVGGPKYNAFIGADAGYSPGMDYEIEGIKRGGYRIGATAGMYVPFIDFN